MGVYIEGLTTPSAPTLGDAMKHLKRGLSSRSTASTNMNSVSSRSHAVFALTVTTTDTTNTDLKKVTRGKFHLVDLAGSERQKATQAEKERLKEASMINKSLLCLGHVISALVDIETGKKDRHVHYRDSKLTYLLRDSWGGNSKTVLIATVSGESRDFGETLSTLKFAQRAKCIRNSVSCNEDTSGTIGALEGEIRRLRSELALRSGDSGNSQGSSHHNTGNNLDDALVLSCVSECSKLKQSSNHLAAQVTKYEALIKSMEEKRKEELFLSEIRKKRIELFFNKDNKDNKNTTSFVSEEETELLCEEIDSLQRALKIPNPEVEKWKLMYEKVASSESPGDESDASDESSRTSPHLYSTQLEAKNESLIADKKKLNEQLDEMEKKLKKQMNMQTIIDSPESHEENETLVSNEKLVAAEKEKEKVENELAQQIITVEAEKASNQKLLAKLNEATQQLRERNITIKTLHEQHEEQLKNLQEQIADESEFFKIEKETNENDLREKLASTMKDNVVLIQRLEDANAKHSELAREVEDAETSRVKEEKEAKEREQAREDRIANLEKELAQLKSEQEAERTQRENERKEAILEVDRFRKKAQNAEFDLENCQEDVDTMQEQIMFLRKTNDEYEEEINGLEERLMIAEAVHSGRNVGRGMIDESSQESAQESEDEREEDDNDNDNKRHFGDDLSNKEAADESAKSNRFKRRGANENNRRKERQYIS